MKTKTLRKSLVERSKVARSVGGAGIIRQLPMTDRLLVGAEIAKELGRDNAMKKAVGRALDRLMDGDDSLKAIEIAKKYGFPEREKKAIERYIDDYHLSDGISLEDLLTTKWYLRGFKGESKEYSNACDAALSLATEYEHQELAAKLAELKIRVQMRDGRYYDARQTAGKHGQARYLEILDSLKKIL